MTRDELKAKLTTIVCDLTLTKEQRSNKLGPIAAQFIAEQEESEIVVDYDAVMNNWDNIMAEIVLENNLGRQ